LISNDKINCNEGNPQKDREGVGLRNFIDDDCGFRETEFTEPDNGIYKIRLYYKLPYGGFPLVNVDFSQVK
jgi:hypothetical protein